MKATAIAMLFVSVYWIKQGIEIWGTDIGKGGSLIILGILMLPLAKYMWNRNPPTSSV